MKKLLAMTALLTIGASTTASAAYYEECYWGYNSWGRRVRVCHTVYRPSPVADAVVVGAIAGGVAGAMASTCAPESLGSNLNSTDTVLRDLAASPEFKEQQTFKDMVAKISGEDSAQKRIDGYFALVDVTTADEAVHFIGARKSEFEKYSAILSKNTELPTELADVVVDSLTASLKGSLR